ncbi:MAG: AraC family transcriptional regulator [Flagellimonas sp.]
MISYLFIIGIAQGILLSINFFQKSKSNPQYIWLALLTGVATLLVSDSWIVYENLDFKYHIFHVLSTAVIFLLGPLLYFFVKFNSGAGEKKPKAITIGFHFIPFVIFLLVLVHFIFFAEENVSNEIFDGDYTLKATSPNIILPLIKLIHLLIYTSLSIKLLSPTVDHSKNLFRTLIFGYLILQGIMWTFLLITILFEVKLFQFTDLILGVVISISIYIFGYLNLKQSDILSITVRNVFKKKYGTTNLEKLQSHKLYEKLIVHMDKEEPYLDPEITLRSLASELQLPPHQLSQVINQNSDYNFSNLINHYRVEKFKLLVQDPRFKNHTLLSIALESGFNNKNSFNQAFKKETGHTPSQYRKSVFLK